MIGDNSFLVVNTNVADYIYGLAKHYPPNSSITIYLEDLTSKFRNFKPTRENFEFIVDYIKSTYNFFLLIDTVSPIIVQFTVLDVYEYNKKKKPNPYLNMQWNNPLQELTEKDKAIMTKTAIHIIDILKYKSDEYTTIYWHDIEEQYNFVIRNPVKDIIIKKFRSYNIRVDADKTHINIYANRSTFTNPNIGVEI